MKKIEQCLEEMSQAKQRFLNMIGDWTAEELRFRPDGEGWNALQIMDHIILSERGTLAYMMKKTSSGWEDIPVATEENAHNSGKLDDALISPSKWKAPSVMPDPTDDRELEEVIQYWHGLRIKFGEFVTQLPPEFHERQVFRHPYAGRLNLYHTLSFLSKHIDHHCHQIERITATMNSSLK